MTSRNIFSNIPAQPSQEIFESIINHKNFKLERIVSTGQRTAEGEWCDQHANEWVILLKGSAGIRFEHEPEILTLVPGDHLLISAHKKHRVEWTAPGEETVWIALHY